MTIKLILVQCMEHKCRVVYGCKVETSTAIIETECETCEFGNVCQVRKGLELFDISHGICPTCFPERVKETKELNAMMEELKNGDNSA